MQDTQRPGTHTRFFTRTLRRRSLHLNRSWIKKRLSLAVSMGRQMRSLEAMHVLVLLFPAVGMLPAVISAAFVYSDGTFPHRGIEDPDPMLRFTPQTFYPEPFASLSNICYITSGLGLFLLPVLTGSFLAGHIFGIGLLYGFLGAGSWCGAHN